MSSRCAFACSAEKMLLRIPRVIGISLTLLLASAALFLLVIIPAFKQTREQAFNVAIPTGEKYMFTFERDGFYDVGCDIHPGMSAQIVSASSPYMTLADAQGNFVIEGVPPGAYKAVVYAGSAKSG